MHWVLPIQSLEWQSFLLMKSHAVGCVGWWGWWCEVIIPIVICRCNCCPCGDGTNDGCGGEGTFDGKVEDSHGFYTTYKAFLCYSQRSAWIVRAFDWTEMQRSIDCICIASRRQSWKFAKHVTLNGRKAFSGTKLLIVWVPAVAFSPFVCFWRSQCFRKTS